MSRHQNITDTAKLTLCLILLAAPAALAGDFPPALLPVGIDPNMAIHFDPNELSRLLADWGPEGVYRKQGAEVVPWTKETALPSPDNAALLYYQAFLLRPQADEGTSDLIHAVLRGAEPDYKIRAYLGHCRETIRLAEMAGQMPQCTWGLSHPGGGYALMPVITEARQLAFVLAVDARTLAFDGNDRAALARCLAIRQLARHIGDDTLIMFLVSLTTDTFAHGTMRDVLSIQPAQTETLQWLRGQLAATDGAPRSLSKVVYRDFELAMDQICRDTARLAEIRTSWPAETSSMTDEEIVARARELRQPFQEGVQAVLDSDMPYELKQSEIQRLGAELEARYVGETLDEQLWLSAAPPTQIAGVHDLHNRAIAYASAVKIAATVYLEFAETGRLPESLPNHMPKDPFSGEEFGYEVTADGFLLRRHVVDPKQDRLWEYEFLVQD